MHNNMGMGATAPCNDAGLPNMKFVRRPDLTPAVRLHIAFTALTARSLREWGVVTELANEWSVSRNFVYYLASTLARVNEIIFGEGTARQNPGDDAKSLFRRMLSLRLEGRCAIEASSTVMARFGEKSSSTGAISQHLKYFGGIVPNTLRNDRSEMRLVVFASDEIFARRKPILLTVDPVSSAILRIDRSDTRKVGDWRNHWRIILENGYNASLLVCDEGQGLCAAHKAALPDVIRQTDTYHAIAHQLGLWIKRLEDAAYKAIEAEYRYYEKLDSARSDRVVEKRINKFEELQGITVEKIELFESFEFLYKCLISELRIFNSEGGLRDRNVAEGNIKAGLDLIKAMNVGKLSATADKIRRTLPKLLNYFDTARDAVGKLERRHPDDAALRHLCLAWQWGRGALKAKKPKRYRHCTENEWLYLQVAEERLRKNFENVKERVYKELDGIVQSSAMVECVNSIIRPYLNGSKNNITQETLNLIMFYHNHRRYRAGKRKGSTPMELLTGKKQEKDWIDLLFDLVGEKDPKFFSSRL